MKRSLSFASVLVLVLAVAVSAAAQMTQKPEWSMNATIIEACTCPMFCQCYFNAQPAAHHDGHGSHRYCKGNLAFKVNRGTYNGTKLDGAKFWLAGDIGGDFTKGTAEWGVMTFDPSVSKEQRDGIMAILPKMYPMQWKSFEVAKDAPVEWQASKMMATARLDGGKAGEVILGKASGMTDDPVVIRNLRYLTVPRNEGFILMPNQVQAWRSGDKAFESKGTNGFMITIDINSNDRM
jgi:hypothetical protein